MMKVSGRAVAVAVGLFSALVAGCEGDPTGTRHARALEIGAPSAFVDVGQTVELTAVARDASGAPLERARLTWSSSDPSVLEVAAGTVTGRAPGSAFVRVTAGALADSVKITVEAPVASLVVWPADTLRLIRGRKATLFVETSDEAGRPAAHSLRVTSSAAGTAAVEGDEITGVALGSAVVTVRAGARSVSVPVQVVTGASFAFRSLGSFSPAGSKAALNDRGWIAGSIGGQAALWRAGRVTALPSEGFSSSEAVAVNDSGLVVGTAVPADGSAPVLWTWRAGVLRRVPLDGLNVTAGAEIRVHDLNDRGEFVGAVITLVGGVTNVSSFYWDGTRLRRDPAFDGALAINDQGAMVGGHTLVENGVPREIQKPNASTSYWVATDLNDRGQYVGYYAYNAVYRAFVGEGTRSVDLEGGPFFEINDYGDLLGFYIGPSSFGEGAAYVLRSSGERVDLAGVGATVARGMNDLGQVVATQRRSPYTAFLASPGS